jgi:hypothetical protein
MQMLDAAHASETIKKMAEKTYLNFKYPDSQMADQLQVIQSHDPFADEGIDEKLALLNTDAVEKVDMILSLYINAFVEELMATNEKFITMKWDEQHKILLRMAEDKMENMEEMAPEVVLVDSNGVETPGNVPIKKNNQTITSGTKPRKSVRNGLSNA